MTKVIILNTTTLLIMKPIYLFLMACLLIGCAEEKQEKQEKEEQKQDELPQVEEHKMPLPYRIGKIYTKDNKKYMYGGEDSISHFDITNCILKDEQYHYGIGREAFHALIEPEFISVEDADTIYHDTDRFLYLEIGEERRAYSIELLTHHEVVNDVVNGEPVMAAYCILADLGAIYPRTIGGKVFTFALSGYTYHDPEVWDDTDGFVFWDRETESTWWPLIGKGVSGPMLDVDLKVYDEQNWLQTNWADIKNKNVAVQVLKPGQEMTPPENWPRFDETTIDQIKSTL